ncbi:Uncharacterised protein [Vibrio cholerae]|nr:Uncharacterised protein [Vibrio cholerae]CSA61787.1 Uncharacterised protein [Vibrio cholerae]
MFGVLFFIGAQFKLNAAIEVKIDAAIGALTAAASPCNRVDFHLVGVHFILECAFGGCAKQGKAFILHVEHVRAWVTLFQPLISCEW